MTVRPLIGAAIGGILSLSSCSEDESAGDEAPCLPSQETCSGACAFVDVDPENCGACGIQCAPSQACSAGSCSCAPGAEYCGDACVDTRTDARNCGGCAAECVSGQLCADGRCDCLSGLGACGDACVDIESDPEHCGACGTACATTEVCSLGSCAAECAAGLTQCGQSCVNLDDSSAHCGACDEPCAAGLACSGGACSCPDGRTACAERCVDVATDAAHCGACDAACTGGRACESGACACPGTDEFCGGQCVSTASNPLHCGTCDSACPSGSCSAGACAPQGTGGAGGTGGAAGTGGTGGAAASGGTSGAGGAGGTSGAGGSPAVDAGPMPPTTQYVVVDQFGYLPSSEKIAVIRDPVTGFDSGESFAPGATYELVDAATRQVALSGTPVAWNGGNEDPSSGDRAWWFDFSSVTTPGDYYVLDVDQNVRSEVFTISTDVYRVVLEQAVRTFFYQRAGHDKSAQHAGAGWADGASHLGPLQDANCRRYDAPNDAATERDLRGGWYDAGDYNKYTNWTADYVVELLRAYEQNPSAFGDDTNVPESGNGVPDVLDEVKWGLEWLVRMQNADGSVLSIVGLASGSPPSTASGASLYGTESASATLTTAAAFAYGSKVFGALGNASLSTFATDLRTRAGDAWSWAIANPNVIFRNNDSASGTSGLGAGQQEVDDYGRTFKRVLAACHLFEATGDTTYRDAFDQIYGQVHLIEWGFAYPYEEFQQDTLLHCASVPNATGSVSTNIRQVYRSAMDGADNLAALNDEVDPFLAHLSSYTWGSNAVKSRKGSMFAALFAHGVDTTIESTARRGAMRYLHYLHGVNPLGLAYLSNMSSYGADRSANEFYHSWFADGSALWDRVGVSTHGPAPGFLTGGPNPSYDWDGCCPGGCGGASCTSESITPPKGQPAQKSYKDFNTGWPMNSWAVTENSNGYQAAYIRLLSKFVQ